MASALLMISLLLAQSYKWIDKDGEIHLTNTPPPADSPSVVAVHPKADTPKAVPAAEPEALRRFEIPYLGCEGRARRVIVQVQFNGRVSAPMALDTGSPGLIISQALAAKLDLFSRDEGALIVAARGLGGTELAIRGIVDKLAIGGAEQRFVPVTVTTDSLSDSFDGVVGMDFMSQYSMTVNSARQVVVLQEQPAADAPGGHLEAWWRDTFAEFRGQRDGWKSFIALLDRGLEDNSTSGGESRTNMERWRKGAKLELDEAEKLLARLERYASSVAAPRHWR